MSTFVDSLLDLLAPLGGVTARRMFGGYGIYKETLMFGLVADDRFYIRTDEETRDRFLDKGCEPFVFGRNKEGKEIVSKYYEPPEMAFANEQRMKPWALMGWECSLRSAKETPAKKKKPKVEKAEATAKTKKAAKKSAQKTSRSAKKKSEP